MVRFFKTLVICCAFFTICCGMKAQYLPLIEEGKRWTYYAHPSLPVDMAGQCSYEWIEGDSVVDGHAAKKLYALNDLTGWVPEYAGAFYEEDGKVYYHAVAERSSWWLMYDFSMKIGDRISYNTDLCLTVWDIGTETFYGTDRKVYTLVNEEWGEVNTYWIEGIGSIQGLRAPYFLKGGLSFGMCEKDGLVIYMNEDVTSVPQINEEKNGRIVIYDLQGRRLTREPEKGMYIKNGRKYLKR